MFMSAGDYALCLCRRGIMPYVYVIYRVGCLVRESQSLQAIHRHIACEHRALEIRHSHSHSLDDCRHALTKPGQITFTSAFMAYE